MLKGKSVLVASKNNKAVDNIKERFDIVDDNRYLLRFGSREMITSKLLPSLNTFIASIPNLHYDGAVLAKLMSDYDHRCESASDARRFLSELVKLTDSVPEYEVQIQQLENERKDIELDYKTNLEELHASNCDVIELSARKGYDWSLMLVGVQKHINTLEANKRGLRKLYFNWFSKDKYTAQVLNDILLLPVEVKDWIENESGIKQVSDVKDCSDLLRLCQIELSHIRRINSYCLNLAKLKSRYAISISDVDNKLSEVNTKLNITKERINTLANAQEQLLGTISRDREFIASISGDLLSNLIKSRLVAPNTRQAIAKYKNYLPDNMPWKDQDLPTFNAHAKEFIDAFRLNSVTSLSVKSAYPLKSELFDIVIIDEASQCDVASALPLIYRAKQVVVIGDPMQLKHITSVTVPEEKVIKNHLTLNENPFIRYAEYSLWDYCHDLITTASVNNTQIVLDSHYRCHPQIIGYSNEMFYQRRLGTTLKVCTKDTNCELRHKGIIWVDVIGSQKSETRNVNEAEIDKAISIAKDIAYQCPNVSIGIISPFKHQAEEMNTKIPDELRGRIISDTVNKFQGDERDVIIFSTVVTDNSPSRKIQWIDKCVKNLVNVAVTRAKSALYVVGNREYIRKHSTIEDPLGYLVDYTEHRALVTTARTETIIIDTNVFVDCPDILDHIEPSKQVVISAKVIDELDKLKVTIEESKKRNVELAIRNLNRIFKFRSIRMECADFDYLPVDFSRRNPDNMILSVALKHRNHNPVLITSDNGLQLKAKGLDIRTISLQTILNG
jgi:rRNA-processing protein FCF1